MEDRVWFDLAIPPAEFSCPVCRDDAPKQAYLRASGTHGRTEDLFQCASCRTLTYFPQPSPDYVTHTASELTIRDYVELNAGVDTHARQVFDLCAGESGRLLDVGCGLGFGLDFAVRSLGWEAQGFEPSTYGSEGARLLSLDIRTEFATANPDPANRFDVVYCSEVLEHVGDPWQFLRLLASYLKDDGVLFLTTPDPERIVRGAPGAELLSLLSPGFHTVLLPASVIAGMLAVLGFKSVIIDATQASTRVYASRSPRVMQRRPGFDAAYAAYLEGLIARLQPGTPLHNGIRYRLYRWFCDRGEWDGADKWFDAGLIASHPDLDAVETMADYASKYPLCVAPATYCRAMQLINQKRDYPGAAQHFRAAYALCRKKIGLDRSTSVGEEDILYQALFHEALALSYAGQPREASVVLARLLAADNDPPVPAAVLERTRTLQAGLPA